VAGLAYPSDEVGESIRGIQEETTKAVDRMQSSPNKMVEGVRQAAQAAVQLSTKSEELQSLVSQFKLD